MASLTPQKGVSHVETFKVAGVTYNNRQQNLMKIQEQINKGKKLNIGIEQYDYKGHPAVSVTVNGLDIGNLHQKDADYVLANQDRILGFTNLFIDKFNNEEGKTIYYARVELLVKNKTASNEKATKTETSAPTVQAPNAEASTPTVQAPNAEASAPQPPTNVKRPFYKNWKFWVIVGAALTVIYIIGNIAGLTHK